MATPPFNIVETSPADNDIVSQYPTVERTFRDVTESWLKIEHNVQGRHDKVSLDDQITDLAGIDNVIRIYNKGGLLFQITGSAGTPKALPLDASLLAPLANPVFTGDPQAPTAALTDIDTSIATTAFVQNLANSRGAGTGHYSNFIMTNNGSNPNTQIDYVADELSVRVPGGAGYTLAGWSGTINSANTGVNGLDNGSSLANSARYAVLAIYNPATGAKGLMLTTEATVNSPTLPSGYTAYKRYGWVLTNSVGALFKFQQNNDSIAFTSPTQQAAAPLLVISGPTNTFDTISPSGTTGTQVRGSSKALPSTAIEVTLNVTNEYKNIGAANILIAPNASWAGVQQGPAGSVGVTWPIYLQAGLGTSGQVTMRLESDNIFAWCSNASGVSITGYKDRI